MKAIITIKNLEIHVYEADEGVVCYIFPVNEKSPETIASTYAFFDEAEPLND